MEIGLELLSQARLNDVGFSDRIGQVDCLD